MAPPPLPLPPLSVGPSPVSRGAVSAGLLSLITSSRSRLPLSPLVCSLAPRVSRRLGLVAPGLPRRALPGRGSHDGCLALTPYLSQRPVPVRCLRFTSSLRVYAPLPPPLSLPVPPPPRRAPCRPLDLWILLILSLHRPPPCAPCPLRVSLPHVGRIWRVPGCAAPLPPPPPPPAPPPAPPPRSGPLLRRAGGPALSACSCRGLCPASPPPPLAAPPPAVWSRLAPAPGLSSPSSLIGRTHCSRPWWC